MLKKLQIVEVPIPTYYGDEICHVNGLKYAWNVFKTMLRAQFHEMNVLFDRKFDVCPREETYDIKLGFASSHTAAIEAAIPGSRLLDIGCGQGYVANELAAKGCRVTGMALNLIAAMKLRQNKLEAAWQVQRRAVARQPDEPRQHLILSDILERMGRNDEARVALARASELHALVRSPSP